MAQYDYDLFVIGAGSGGVRASRWAAKLGAKVAVAEERYLGGTCVNVGCIPKKLLSYAAHYHEDFEDAAGYGWTVGESSFDWPALIAAKDREITRLNGVYERLLKGSGVVLFNARATVVDAHTVEVAGKRVTAAHILVATGGWPSKPDIPGADLAITSNEAFYLPSLPERVIVYGGGYIAVEFASIFAGLGAKTTLVYRGKCLLREFDADLGAALATEMAAKGVDIRLETTIESLAKHSDGLAATLSSGDRLEAGCALFATGRSAKVDGLGLEDAGVALTATGAVRVDENFQSSVPSIHAIGDVIHRVQLTPVALAEGMVVAERLFGKGQRGISYDNIATAVFSHPNIATVGLSEEAARHHGHKVTIFRSSFTALRHTLSGRKEKTLMKLVVDADTDRVLGVHMLGPDAGEVIQGFAVALNCGATKSDFDRTIGIHPTAAEEFVTMRDPVPG